MSVSAPCALCWRAIEVDDCLEYWNRNDIKRTGWVCVTPRWNVHICSLTPNCEALPIYPFVEMLDPADDGESVLDEQYEYTDTGCWYLDSSFNNKPGKDWDFTPASSDFDDEEALSVTEDQERERVCEAWRSNCPL